MKRQLQYLSCAVVAAGLAIASCVQQPQMRSTPAVKLAAKAEEPFPARIVEMRGSGEEMGQAHAQQLASPIRELFENYLGQYFANEFQKNLALTAASAYGPHIAPEHLAEIKGLSRGTGMDEREVLLGQCFLDLTSPIACSTITLPASASPDGVARFGRNLDFPSYGVADSRSVVLVFHPAGRYAFVSIAWPGMIGVLSGMNEHGLTLANMEVYRGRRLPMAMPYVLLYRTVLEQCRTVDEAIELLKNTPRQTANNLMLMDADGNRAVAEITPEDVTIRRAPDHAALISTNHQRGSDDLDTAGRCPRFDVLHDGSAEHFGKIDRDRLEGMLAEVSQGRMTLQSMVFEPATRTLYLATGADAPEHGYHRLDLKPYFESR
jgi:predicted choloylglycine hydrolase